MEFHSNEFYNNPEENATDERDIQEKQAQQIGAFSIHERMPQMKEISKKNKLNKLELSRFMIPSILPGNVPTMCSSPQNSTQ